MAEYIEREALLREIERREALMVGDKLGSIDAMKSFIKNRPAADVVPVRHGRWTFGKDLPYNWGQIPKNKYHLYCSECLEQAFNRSEDNDPDFDADTSYSPNCGAKMDGGDGNSAMA